MYVDLQQVEDISTINRPKKKKRNNVNTTLPRRGTNPWLIDKVNENKSMGMISYVFCIFDVPSIVIECSQCMGYTNMVLTCVVEMSHAW